ncbi:MAG: aldehyde dehydrogenase family protein, partial [Fusobacteriaceae bacterium]
MKYGIINNYVNGKYVNGSGKTVDIDSPVDGKILGQVIESTAKDLDDAVKLATIAQKEWGDLSLKKRSDVIFNYRNLLIKYRDELAESAHLENGKDMNEAYAEVDKAIELTSFACSLPQIATGEIEEVSTGVVCREERRPLGVVGVITPFNFPVMVPHWSIPNAIALGNAVIV